MVSIWIVSLLSVDLSASDKLTKKELDAFMVIVTNYIMSDEDKQAPVFITASSITVLENQTSAYQVKVRDASPVDFTLLRGDSAYFDIDTSTGIITFNDAPLFATKNSYSFTIKATDSRGNSSTQSVTIHIRNPALDKPKKTGQIEVYVTYDDGYYRKGLDHSYTRNNATDVVTDNVTGLQWQDDAGVKTVHTKYITTAIDYCKNLNLAGNGWRLPSIQEFNTIIMRGKPRPNLHSRFRNYMSNNTFITSTKATDGVGLYSWNTYYWVVTAGGSLSYREVNRSDSTNFYIRCVR